MWGKKVWTLDDNIPVNPLDQVIPGIWHSISEREIGLKMCSPLVLQRVLKNVEGLEVWCLQTASLHCLACCFCSWAWFCSTLKHIVSFDPGIHVWIQLPVLWCEYIVWCRRAHLTPRLPRAMIHSIMAACVSQSMKKKLITCLLISCRFSAINSTQPPLTHVCCTYIRKASGIHLINISTKSFRWDIPEKNVTFMLQRFSRILWAGYSLKMCRKQR